MPSNFKALAGASGGEPTDANFKNVTLLLHGDGSNGAQNNTFLDSSTNNFTITRNGNTTQGSFSPYGSNWSNYFDGSGDYLTASPTALSTGDFTFECWIYSTGTGQYQYFYDTRASTNDAAGFCVIYNHASYPNKVSIYSNGFIGTPTIDIPVGAWTHYALVRSSGSWRTFVNGAADISPTSASRTLSNTALKIAAGQALDYFFNGYISNYRIVNGTAVYTTTFTPPTAPLTAITNTSLLTCQSNRIRDASTNNFTITRNGDVKVTNFAPFAPSSAYSTTANGGSAYFDGTGDYLTTPNNAAFAFGTGDYTIELWINTNADTGNVIDFRVGGNLTPYPAIYLSGGVAYFWTGTGSDGVSVGSYTKNAWVHLAVSRSGSSLKFFINGVQTYSASDTTNLSQGTVTIAARWDAGNLFAGYISNFRVVKGTAVYTAAFTPPTAPVTAITNTSLLTNFTNAAIFDNSMKNDLETVGNAQISTSVKKFGTGSMSFDGNGDYLTPNIPTTDMYSFGTGDFTIEAWVYLNSVSTYAGIIDTRASAGTSNYALGIWANSGNKLDFIYGSTRLTSASNISTGSWVHLAVTRESGRIRLFINGVVDANNVLHTGAIDCSRAQPLIGAVQDPYYLNGYIDDMRITKGIARYNTTFTPPTAAFPDQ